MSLIKVFFDTSALIAAAGSESGASYFLLVNCQKLKIIPVSSHYCLAELDRNINKLHGAHRRWNSQLIDCINFVVDIAAHSQIFSKLPAKDTPILAAVVSEDCRYLLTLDRKDFGNLLGTTVHNVRILTPGDFLTQIRRS